MQASKDVGVDFGTTNSALALHEGDELRMAKYHEGSETFRSVLYFPADRKPVCAGPVAIERYLEEHAEGQSGGRLIQSVKSLLASRLFTNTQINGRRYSAEDLVMMMVRALRAEATAQLGDLGRRAVVGRPVRFVGADSADDEEMALTRLSGAFATAGFTDTTFAYEPVGAAYFYESRLESDELILIGDFGGGTSDFSLMRVGPSFRNRAARRKIMATEGIPLAGDAFDARIVRHVVSPLLGEGTEYRSIHKLLPVAASVYRKLERWHHLSFLRSPDTMRMLRSIEVTAVEPEKIGKLIALIENDLGLQLHRAVQRTKFELSSARQSLFSFQHPEVMIEKLVTRVEFEDWIEPELDQIAEGVEKLMVRAKVDEAAIHRVFLTGGSSLVPAVQRIFVHRFGEEKIAAGDEFTSVAKGLALCAAR